MIIRVPEEVVRLADIFDKYHEKLYLVGGFVRNQILGIPDFYNVDIDICSSVEPKKIFEMLNDTEFSVKYMNEETGVLEIKNNIRVEHATFRKEKYKLSGVHLPDNVKFIKDLKEDAKRRDFRCNAIYYDILNKEIVDPFDGVSDTEKHIIRTVLSPNETLSEDSERILRMVRFACTLGFTIDKQTYDEAKNLAFKLQGLSASRKREEFNKILLADTKYNFLPDIKYAHARGVSFLADLGTLKYLLPALDGIKNSGIIEDKGKPLFEHVMNVFALSAPEIRLSALLHDFGKAVTLIENKNFIGNEEYADFIIEKNLGQEGLCYPKKIVERVKKVVRCNNFNKLGFETNKNIKQFIVENIDVVELVIALKNAIALDKSNFKRQSFSALKIFKVYQTMKDKNTPMSVSELAINGDDIIRTIENIRPYKIGDLLNKLLYICLDKPYINKKEELIVKAIHEVNKNKKLYLEL